MPKKTATKTKLQSKLQSKAKSKKTAAAKPAPKATAGSTGMWKILEMKKAQQKLNEQSRSEGRNGKTQGQAFQSHPRDPRFTKFAGPRRKVG